VLAYLFWHRPRRGAERDEYEAAQRSFHAALETESACFRLAELPFGGGPGYEDWYLVDGWAGLGALNAAAVDARRRPEHDRAAALAAGGWGGVYSLVRGETAIPAGTEWRDKPRGQASGDFLAALPETAVWRRELVLGPAPEICLATTATAGRERL
jgi:hypothetical protein